MEIDLLRKSGLVKSIPWYFEAEESMPSGRAACMKPLGTYPNARLGKTARSLLGLDGAAPPRAQSNKGFLVDRIKIFIWSCSPTLHTSRRGGVLRDRHPSSC